MKTLHTSILAMLVLCFTSLAQTQEISGVVSAVGNVEGIHVMNKTSYKYATTNNKGEFIIDVKPLDSIYFSSIQYSPKVVIVTKEILAAGFMAVYLEENITALDEVTIGQILTGDLNSDIINSEAKRPIDFYDLGIPGYTGPRKTQQESRLYEADAGKMVYVGFPYVAFNFNKFLNTITGRTKKLKQRVALENEKSILNHIKDVVGPELFKQQPLDNNLKEEFYLYCTDDPTFKMRCHNKSDVEILQFLEQKLIEFKSNNLSKK